jgi:Trypsin-co-occurring domain 1
MTAARLPAANQREILIEIDDAVVVVTPPAAPKPMEDGQTEGRAEDIANRMVAISQLIGDTCSSMVEHVRRATSAVKAEEWTLEFSIKLAGEAAVPMISKISAEGAIKVSAKFKG